MATTVTVRAGARDHARLPAEVFRTETLYGTGPRDAAGVDCGFVLKPSAARGGYRDRVIPRYVAVYVLRGSGTFIDGEGREHRVEAGCVIQHRPGERCGVQPDSDGQWAEFFVVAPVALHAALVAMGSLEARTAVLRPGVDGTLVARCEDVLDAKRHPDRDADRGVLVRVHVLLAEFQRYHERRLRPTHQVDRVAQARVWLATDFHKPIDLVRLAGRLDMSYERFRKVFREHVGVSPGEYRIHRRVDAARALLAGGTLTNKEVAYRLGYSDPFTFSKQFKRYVGVSPETFRRTV